VRRGRERKRRQHTTGAHARTLHHTRGSLILRAAPPLSCRLLSLLPSLTPSPAELSLLRHSLARKEEEGRRGERERDRAATRREVAELDRVARQLAAMDTGGSGGGGGGDDVRGLKFGKIYFEQDAAASAARGGGRKGKGAAAGSSDGPGAAASSVTAGPAAPQQPRAATPPRCQVEGCGVDLSSAKPYYCRHKVCSMHSKTPLVVVAGIEQRFCQQCSR
jgi:hypothetical protein